VVYAPVELAYEVTSDANALFGPVGLVDFGEAMSEVESVAADEWRDRGNPAAIGAIVLLQR